MIKILETEALKTYRSLLFKPPDALPESRVVEPVPGERWQLCYICRRKMITKKHGLWSLVVVILLRVFWSLRIGILSPLIIPSMILLP